jgi:hypothetical protein
VTKMQNCWAETGVEHEKGIDKAQDAVLAESPDLPGCHDLCHTSALLNAWVTTSNRRGHLKYPMIGCSHETAATLAASI